VLLHKFKAITNIKQFQAGVREARRKVREVSRIYDSCWMVFSNEKLVNRVLFGHLDHEIVNFAHNDRLDLLMLENL